MNSNAHIKQEDQPASLHSDYRFAPTPPSSDSGWTTPSDWSQYSSPANSPALPLPSIRLARSVRGTERQREHFLASRHEEDTSSTSSPYYRLPTQPPCPPTPPPTSKSKHVPRPPNAFILYRSDFLKRGIIPPHVERRQQNLSRVAGQCWNLLSDEEKQVWQVKAAERSQLHQQEHPDYHFKPSPRGKGKAKTRAGEEKGEDMIRSLREKYTHVTGPAVCAPRQRKARTQAKTADGNHQVSSQATPTDAPLAAPLAYAAPDLSSYQWGMPPSHASSPSLPSPEPASNGPALPPFFPQQTFPHFAPRRPSTSLGFVRRLEEDASCFQPGYGPDRPASAASDTGLSTLVRDLNITPTTANFRNISMPPTPDPYAIPYSTTDHADVIRAPFPFSALNTPYPFPNMSTTAASGLRSAEQGATSDGSAFNSPYSDAPFFIPGLDDSYFSGDPNLAFALDNWALDTSSFNQLEATPNQ
ncbi:hypothetical protein B0H10DRAFT_164510 [Mycena sp. CBHHK59/15]|nr:hypothetical protein B0H10DRAFT_164510 [Mycena sp. CBHHK59/15]